MQSSGFSPELLSPHGALNFDAWLGRRHLPHSKCHSAFFTSEDVSASSNVIGDSPTEAFANPRLLIVLLSLKMAFTELESVQSVPTKLDVNLVPSETKTMAKSDGPLVDDVAGHMALELQALVEL